MLKYLFIIIYIIGLLKFIILSLYLNIFLYLINCYDYFFLIIFLTIRVCERSLGLSILILIIRIHGNDYILTLNSLW